MPDSSRQSTRARGYFRYTRRGGVGYAVHPAPHDPELSFAHGRSLGRKPVPRGELAALTGEWTLDGFAAARQNMPLAACRHGPGPARRAWVSGWLSANTSLNGYAAPMREKTWSDLEHELLDQARARKVPYEHIGVLLGRSAGACRIEATRRGLTKPGRAPGHTLANRRQRS